MALRRYKPKHFVTTVAAASQPEYLHDAGRKLYGFQLIADKGFDEDGEVIENTGPIWIQIDGSDAERLDPGQRLTWPQPPYEAGFFDSKSFKIRVDNDGDGVRCLYNEFP